MEAKEALDLINNIPFPNSAKFIDNKRIEVEFTSPFNELDETSTTISYLRLDSEELEDPILSYNDSEALTCYSSDGKKRAVLRQISHQKTMPSSVSKFKEKVSIIEVFQGQQIIKRKILDEEFANFQKHPTISNGLLFSPENNKLIFTVADEDKFERESILGYKIKMSEFKDYGEDMSEIYHTSLAIYNIDKNEVSKIKAPEGFCVCKSLFVTENILLFQAVDYSQARILGLRSYSNRLFTLFAVDLNKPNEIKKISEPKQVFFDVFKINDTTAKVFTFEFPDNFPGHDAPLYPKTFIINLNNFEVSNIKKSNQEISVHESPSKFFINENKIAFSEEFHGLVLGTILDLENFSKIKLPGDISTEILDIKDNKLLVLKSTPSTIPQLSLIDINDNFKEKKLTKFYDFGFEHFIDYLNDDFSSVIGLISKSSKKFILLPHGGPHGMTSNIFNKRALIFALMGYNVVHVNYTGSTGQSLESIKKIFGKAGTIDLEDVVSAAKYIKEKYKPEKLGIWGFSHGGFLSSHMAAKHSDLIDFAVIGAPVTNFVSSYFSSDIPDWALVEAGLTNKCDGEINLSPEVYEKLWEMSPLKYIDGVNVPVLIIHGDIDRRVSIGQSIELFTTLKKLGKKVKFLQYQGNGHSFKHISAADDMVVISVKFFENPEEVINGK